MVLNYFLEASADCLWWLLVSLCCVEMVRRGQCFGS